MSNDSNKQLESMENMLSEIEDHLNDKCAHMPDLIPFVCKIFTTEELKTVIKSNIAQLKASDSISNENTKTLKTNNKYENMIFKLFLSFKCLNGIPCDAVHANILKYLPSMSYRYLPLVSTNFQRILYSNASIFNDKNYEIRIICNRSPITEIIDEYEILTTNDFHIFQKRASIDSLSNNNCTKLPLEFYKNSKNSAKHLLNINIDHKTHIIQLTLISDKNNTKLNPNALQFPFSKINYWAISSTNDMQMHPCIMESEIWMKILNKCRFNVLKLILNSANHSKAWLHLPSLINCQILHVGEHFHANPVNIFVNKSQRSKFQNLEYLELYNLSLTPTMEGVEELHKELMTNDPLNIFTFTNFYPNNNNNRQMEDYVVRRIFLSSGMSNVTTTADITDIYHVYQKIAVLKVLYKNLNQILRSVQQTLKAFCFVVQTNFVENARTLYNIFKNDDNPTLKTAECLNKYINEILGDKKYILNIPKNVEWLYLSGINCKINIRKCDKLLGMILPQPVYYEQIIFSTKYTVPYVQCCYHEFSKAWFEKSVKIGKYAERAKKSTNVEAKGMDKELFKMKLKISDRYIPHKILLLKLKRTEFHEFDHFVEELSDTNEEIDIFKEETINSYHSKTQMFYQLMRVVYDEEDYCQRLIIQSKWEKYQQWWKKGSAQWIAYIGDERKMRMTFYYL